MKLIKSFFILIFLLLQVLSSSAQIDIQVPGFSTDEAEKPNLSQEQSQWCWAASIQAVLKHHNITRTQSEIVQALYGKVINLPSQNNAGIDIALKRLNFSDGKSVEIIKSAALPANLLTTTALYNELNSGNPIIVGYRDFTTPGHAVVIYGATFAPNGFPVTVKYFDPWPGKGDIETEASNFGQSIIVWYPVRAARYVSNSTSTTSSTSRTARTTRSRMPSVTPGSVPSPAFTSAFQKIKISLEGGKEEMKKLCGAPNDVGGYVSLIEIPEMRKGEVNLDHFLYKYEISYRTFFSSKDEAISLYDRVAQEINKNLPTWNMNDVGPEGNIIKRYYFVKIDTDISYELNITDMQSGRYIVYFSGNSL